MSRKCFITFGYDNKIIITKKFDQMVNIEYHHAPGYSKCTLYNEVLPRGADLKQFTILPIGKFFWKIIGTEI